MPAAPAASPRARPSIVPGRRSPAPPSLLLVAALLAAALLAAAAALGNALGGMRTSRGGGAADTERESACALIDGERRVLCTLQYVGAACAEWPWAVLSQPVLCCGRGVDAPMHGEEAHNVVRRVAIWRPPFAMAVSAYCDGRGVSSRQFGGRRAMRAAEPRPCTVGPCAARPPEDYLLQSGREPLPHRETMRPCGRAVMLSLACGRALSCVLCVRVCVCVSTVRSEIAMRDVRVSRWHVGMLDRLLAATTACLGRDTDSCGDTGP